MKPSLLLQGVTTDSHVPAVRHVLNLQSAARVIISVAFMNSAGFSIIRKKLLPIAKHTTILAGIRNGITSAQGLADCLDLGCLTYVVDTGSRRLLFHPKVYFSRNATEARVIVGSANLTYGGLNSNIEASIVLSLSLSDTDDAAFVQSLEDKFDSMTVDYSDNVISLTDRVEIDRLLDAGRVVDETKIRRPVTSGRSRRADLDSIPRIRLMTSTVAVPRIAEYSRESAPARTLASADQVEESYVRGESLTLVWESKPLTRRDLTIPVGPNSNPTGSMLLKKGTFNHIDQRHYFRDEVFPNLEWTPDAGSSRQHIERATASFQFIVSNVSYPPYNLSLSHNTRTDSKSYLQGNGVTNLHWGSARSIVRREELLNRTLFLYRDETRPAHFVIEID